MLVSGVVFRMEHEVRRIDGWRLLHNRVLDPTPLTLLSIDGQAPGFSVSLPPKVALESGTDRSARQHASSSEFVRPTCDKMPRNFTIARAAPPLAH
jgi:hypothetical protein